MTESITQPAAARGPRESRVGAIVCVAALVVLDLLLPKRYQLAPEWLPPLIGAIIVVPMLAQYLSKAPIWSTIERYCITIGIGGAIAANAFNLLSITMRIIFDPKSLNPTSLFSSALMIWAVNVLAFALLYWEIDAGGPETRAAGEPGYSDWDFPERGANPGTVPPNWQPHFVDYFFIAFTTGTAFSPTEAMPLNARSKLLMILQSVVALATISVVAARTINILQ